VVGGPPGAQFLTSWSTSSLFDDFLGSRDVSNEHEWDHLSILEYGGGRGFSPLNISLEVVISRLLHLDFLSEVVLRTRIQRAEDHHVVSSEGFQEYRQNEHRASSNMRRGLRVLISCLSKLFTFLKRTFLLHRLKRRGGGRARFSMTRSTCGSAIAFCPFWWKDSDASQPKIIE
jgi:hypothetical protein